jgi:hypothetical protein
MPNLLKNGLALSIGGSAKAHKEILHGNCTLRRDFVTHHDLAFN